MTLFDYDVNSFWVSPFKQRRFKGGGGGDPPSPQMADTQSMKWARSETYPMIKQGLSGQGFGPPGFSQSRENMSIDAMKTNFGETMGEFDSQLARTIHKDDARVRNYSRNVLDRSQVSALDNLRRGFRQERVADKDMAMDMAGTSLANEQRMGISGAQAYNNALQTSMDTSSRMGTFSTNVAKGVGQGAMDMYFAQQMSK